MRNIGLKEHKKHSKVMTGEKRAASFVPCYADFLSPVVAGVMPPSTLWKNYLEN